MTELPKTIDPAAIESRWYKHWEETGQFRPDRPGAEPWTIVNPPPNVTGSLHIGHALDNTLQDVLVRHARLKGKDALWVVGTDHAGIATQMVVERQLNERQDKRTNYTREAFVEKVWEWKRESGGEITQQLRRLGCSMDWANERFTMDEGFSKAVLKVFVDLYNQGLIYRDKRLVNWDPGLGTAISDLEVETKEVKGSFWQIRYPLADGSGSITVATTRPETMLADMAVAVHPEDERYKAMLGKQIRLPITGRLIPIIADEHADPTLGTGAVKITPGHDFNDFEVGKRAGFKAGEMLNMLDAKAQVTQTSDGLIPDDLLGLDRFEARKRVVERLKADGALVPFVDKDGAGHDAEPRTIQTPYGDRSGDVIEPWLTDQWYVDAETLAKGPIEAVRDGRIRIVPKSWEKTFFNWMENIQPWCVSRQLWWGHRIPAWFGPKKAPANADPSDITWTTEDQPFVALDEAELQRQLIDYYGADKEFAFLASEADYLEWDEAVASNADLAAQNRNKVPIYQDPDVLDTWFSSALWPFATLGWPDDSPLPQAGGAGGGRPTSASDGGHGERAPTPQPPPAGGRGSSLHGRYPNDVLISGFDILFFWDARMMMQGMHFMKDVPFRTLYLHGLVRAADGQKMSKSKGNVVNPLGLIDRYGADALRFFMAAMESQGRDIKMDEKRVEGYRNFATKLWNAARFCQTNGIGASDTLEAPVARHAVNQWIIGETIKTVQAVDMALADYRFDGAANAIYQFVWSRFCDWYLELIKPMLAADAAPDGGDALPRGEPGGGVPAPVDPLQVPEDDRSPTHEGIGAPAETRAVAGWVLDQILVMLHPFMPFVTEELWHAMGARECDLIVAKWPMADARAIDGEAIAEINWLIDTIQELRSQRTETNIPPSAVLPTAMLVTTENELEKINRNQMALNRLARIRPAQVVRENHGAFVFRADSLSDLYVIADKVDRTSFTALQFPVGANTFISSVEGFVDIAAERARLTKAIEAITKERDSLAGRLDNPSFVERAKPEAVEKARADHAEKAAEAERLSAALARLG